MANKRWRKYPSKEDVRFTNGVIFPHVDPLWTFDWPNTNVFTIGSCFARNIEQSLLKLDVTVPTQSFTADKLEWYYYPHPAHILNEYNPGTMSQRINCALDGTSTGTDNLYQTKGGRYHDQLLHTTGNYVTLERAVERRADIDQLYSKLPEADLVIVTLGLIEAWYDPATGNYLNDPPLGKDFKNYTFKRLTVQESVDLLGPAVKRLADRGQRVLITVSPFPLVATFTSDDCVVANEYSKNVLRVVAEELRDGKMVDYFPSYEIVRSAGTVALQDDLIHPDDAMIDQVVSYMIRNYTQR
jgi:hypothetical protein